MRYRILGLFLLLLVSSCDKYLFRSQMLRTGPNYPYSEFEDIKETEYRISSDDRVSVRLYTNDGSGLVNINTGSGKVLVGAGASFSVLIESDGFGKMPLFGRIYLEGLTIRQAEMLIEDKYGEFYNNPFVLLTVGNKRVFLFAGGNTSVVPLTDENTTLFEVLAISGGVPGDGKADKIKIIRGDLRNPEVYIVDLSTLSGMREANLVLQANDIIYIETRKGYIGRILGELSPYLSILTSVITTAAIIAQLRALGNQ